MNKSRRTALMYMIGQAAEQQGYEHPKSFAGISNSRLRRIARGMGISIKTERKKK